MKHTTLKRSILLLAFFSCFTLAAQDELDDEYGNSYNYKKSPIFAPIQEGVADEDDPGSGEEGGGSVEEPEASISMHIPILAFAGMAFAATYFYRRREV